MAMILIYIQYDEVIYKKYALITSVVRPSTYEVKSRKSSNNYEDQRSKSQEECSSNCQEKFSPRY